MLREGRKRQIRRVAATLGHRMRQLIRVRIGPVHLGNLEPALDDLKLYLKRAPEAVDRQAVADLVAQLEAQAIPKGDR